MTLTPSIDMGIDRDTFLRSVTIVVDTREQKNAHVIEELNKLGIMVEHRKLDYCDYSFMAGGRDFTMSCVVERKANVEELYTNVSEGWRDKRRNDESRIEKELEAAFTLSRSCTLIVENVAGWKELEQYEVSALQMIQNPKRQVKAIGKHVYSSLKSWSSNNRYNFNVEFVPDKRLTAAKLLEIFYYYWRNYKELTKARR